MGKRICLLEDDQGIREIIELILTEEQYQVEGFATVKEFMAFEEKEKQDIYLLDVKLPDGNGLDVCRTLKNSKETMNIPVVMMSAHAGLSEMKGLCNADDFIAKPFDVFDLVERLSSCLDASQKNN